MSDLSNVQKQIQDVFDFLGSLFDSDYTTEVIPS